jgi:hypothetical protein
VTQRLGTSGISVGGSGDALSVGTISDGAPPGGIPVASRISPDRNANCLDEAISAISNSIIQQNEQFNCELMKFKAFPDSLIT